MPTKLIFGDARATVVFDAAQRMAQDELAVKLYMGKAFANCEYMYLTSKEFDCTSNTAADDLCNRLQASLEAQQLIDTQRHFNFFFYEDLHELISERLNAILQFLDEINSNLDSPTTRIRSFIIVCKDGCKDVDPVMNMDNVVQKLINVERPDLPRLILVDALPLKPISPWLRACVRFSHMVSRSSELSTMLENAPSDQIWNWTLSEYDVDAAQALGVQREKLQHLINSDYAFPTDRFRANASAIISDKAEHRLQVCIRAEDMPIDREAVGNFTSLLMNRSKIRANVSKFAKTVYDSFMENTVARSLSRPNDDELKAWCAKLIEDIPCNQIEQVPGELRSMFQCGKRQLNIPSIALIECLGINALRDQIREQLNACYRSLQNHISGNIADMLAAYLEKNLETIVSVRKTTLLEEQQKTSTALVTLGGDTYPDAGAYLQALHKIYQYQFSVYVDHYQFVSDYLLVSHQTALNWNQYGKDVPQDIQGGIFDYGELEEYEFQNMTLTSLSSDDYMLSRNQLFKLSPREVNA